MTIGELSDLAVLVLDAQGRIVDMNAAALVLAGRSLAAAIGQPAREVVPLLAQVPGFDATGTGPVCEILLAGGDQQEPLEIRVTPLAGTGQVVTLRSVAARLRAEAAVEAERKRLNDVLEMLPAYVCLLSADYQMPFANRFFRERFGESHGRLCYEYLFGRTEPCEICESFKPFRTGARHHWEWTGPDQRIYDIFDFPFIDSDGSTVIMEMGIDITERKQAEDALQQSNDTLEQRVAERTAELTASQERLVRYAEQLRAQNAELEAFGHTVAHDLKNPLTAVLGFAQNLARNEAIAANPSWSKATRNIVVSAQRMRRIIDALLLLAATREEDVPCEALEMAGIVAEAQAHLAREIAGRRAEIRVPAAWPEATGYTPWVEEVWINLLSNALKYGGERPRIELGADHTPGGQARFWVRDEGPGLPAEAQARLFAPFTRLHQVRTSGHGLGLSIVQRIVDRLGGSVGVESELGKGSLFYFTLPPATPSGAVVSLEGEPVGADA